MAEQFCITSTGRAVSLAPQFNRLTSTAIFIGRAGGGDPDKLHDKQGVIYHAYFSDLAFAGVESFLIFFHEHFLSFFILLVHREMAEIRWAPFKANIPAEPTNSFK